MRNLAISGPHYSHACVHMNSVGQQRHSFLAQTFVVVFISSSTSFNLIMAVRYYPSSFRPKTFNFHTREHLFE